MSEFILSLNNKLDAMHLLNHPFYQAWNAGMLSESTLQLYAKQYYKHVAAFPRYISQIHTLCSNLQDRQILLNNLIDEEKGADNHPDLWLRFAEGLGVSRSEVENEVALSTTEKLVSGYFDLVKSNYESGLGALYAYERQTPEVSKSKIDGLKQHYNIHSDKTLQFFTVHQTADEWHREELTGLLQKLDSQDQQKAEISACEGAQLLWKFLDGIMAHSTEKPPMTCV